MDYQMIIQILLIGLGAGGFYLSYYIYSHKRANTRHSLICPLNFDCDAVIHSKYSTLFGVNLEKWGMLYYGVIFITYLIYILIPQTIPYVFTNLIAGVTIFAFVFSIYLTYLQGVKLKQWCTLCLMSAGFCTVIFFLVIKL